MIKAGQIDKGTALLIKGQPFVCIEREFVNPGKVEDRDMQYLYNDGENFFFQNTETFDQIDVPMKSFPDYQYFMKEGETYRATFWEDQVLDIIIPSKIVFTVAEAEEAVKGDTVQGATKYVTTETGLRVRVPIFIKQGEKIRVNTETKEYLERVNG